MNYDLSKLGIEKDLQYECITTTINKDGVKNAGAFAFQYLGDDKVHCHIFEGSKTLKNILDTNEYVVNITQDPLVFTYATLDCLDDEYYTNDDAIAIIKNTPAYIIVDVVDVEIKTPENFPIKGDNKIYFITGKIRKVVINDEYVQPFNRGMSALIESLVNFARYKIVDENLRKAYMDQLIENQRVINKVSDEKTKRAMDYLKSEYEKN
ncbi:hypothetical protein TL18_07045 [Methanobrevibacter sp. YE315]|uniref:DUF447 domain-containing protein n=1 Tax=Methanobrevibacter sp. YE315 TaxID=1609968 RepID=UPI000764D05B|nr:DUF447 domain-containing protein [Methanobrevibacter sp. YE315]AMD17794.1 hypothetical protein TL18_07045 [Methanobrevibacter sp. YE315]